MLFKNFQFCTTINAKKLLEIERFEMWNEAWSEKLMSRMLIR